VETFITALVLAALLALWRGRDDWGLGLGAAAGLGVLVYFVSDISTPLALNF
jgi:hypothetical protein